MKRIRWATALCVALSALAPATREAGAACNAFPGAKSLFTGGFKQSPAAKAVAAANRAALDRASAPLLYLTPLGRIDGLSFAPGSTVYAAADTTCAGPSYAVPMEARPSFEPKWLDNLIAVAIVPREGARLALARVYTHERGRGHVVPMRLCGLRAAFSGSGIQPLDDCAQATMRTVETGPGKAALGIPLPTEKELLGVAAAAGGLDGASPGLAFTLMAMAPPESLASLVDVVRGIEEKGCEQSCKNFVSPVGSRGALCADQVVSIGWSRYGDFVRYLNDGFPDCDAGGPSIALNGPTNAFKNLCEEDTAGTGLCSSTPAEQVLSMRQDSCGRLHIPFTWDGVFVSKPVVLAGQSATSRKRLGEENRIWVPGREFVGSTPTASSNDGGADVDWRKPDITVWYPTSTEFGLKGVVDKSEPATVHIFPNYEVRVQCDQPLASGVPEACEGVDRGVNASIPNCACRDRYAADCTCKEDVGRYFACVGGGRDGMPCTRHDHCNKDGAADGLCNGQAVCRPAGAVYRVDTSGATGPPCGTDANCEDRTDGLTQCGYRLFDLSAQVEGTGKAIVHLNQRLKHGGKKRRGTCVDSPAAGCNNLDDTSGPKGCQSGECRGYRLIVTK